MDNNGRLLGATSDQRKIIQDTIGAGAQVSTASESGTAGVVAALFKSIGKEAAASATKLNDLAHAKDFPELIERIMAECFENASNRYFRVFVRGHIKTLARMNDDYGFPITKRYHYDVYNERDYRLKAYPEDAEIYYQTLASGHAEFLSRAREEGAKKNANKGGGGGGGRYNKKNKGGGGGGGQGQNQHQGQAGGGGGGQGQGRNGGGRPFRNQQQQAGAGAASPPGQV